MNKLVTKLNVESQSFQVRCILNQRKVVAIFFSKDLPASSKDFPKLVNTTAGSGPLWVANAELGKDLGKELGNDLVCADGPVPIFLTKKYWYRYQYFLLRNIGTDLELDIGVEK